MSIYTPQYVQNITHPASKLIPLITPNMVVIEDDNFDETDSGVILQPVEKKMKMSLLEFIRSFEIMDISALDFLVIYVFLLYWNQQCNKVSSLTVFVVSLILAFVFKKLTNLGFKK